MEAVKGGGEVGICPIRAARDIRGRQDGDIIAANPDLLEFLTNKIDRRGRPKNSSP